MKPPKNIEHYRKSTLFNADSIQKELGIVFSKDEDNSKAGSSSPGTQKRGESLNKKSTRGSIKKSIVNLFRSSPQSMLLSIEY